MYPGAINAACVFTFYLLQVQFVYILYTDCCPNPKAPFPGVMLVPQALGVVKYVDGIWRKGTTHSGVVPFGAGIGG